MYLSRAVLDANRRETMDALGSPQKLHGAIERSFDERQRNLWRIDWLNDICYLLLLSEKTPDMKQLLNQFGEINSPKYWETKVYDKLLNKLEIGQSWRFRLCGNPVQSSTVEKNPKTGRGKVYAHVTCEQQKKWLIGKANSCGFSLSEESFGVIQNKWLKFHKGGESRRPVSLHTVIFEGLLTITDLELFRQALKTGIGRGKAYGCGLLTITRD